MELPPILILGAGSQAKVVIDLVRAVGAFEPCAALDLNPSGARKGTRILDIEVVGTLAELKEVAQLYGASHAALAIGDAAQREIAFTQAEAAGLMLPMLIHPSAILASGAAIGAGSVICAQAFVGVDASLGVGVIVNTAAGVDHDNEIGDFAHIAVGARLAGNVTLGQGVEMGAGSVAIPGVSIGAGTRVGAGAVVVGDLPAKVTAVGVPAKVRS